MSAFSVDTPTDDASTRQWRASQQTGPIRTTRRPDAQLVDVLVINIFSGFGTAKNIEID